VSRHRRACGPLSAFLAAVLLTGPARATVTTGQDSETGLRSWKWEHQGVSVELRQLLPDQTRAFFLGRGFGTAEADRIGRSCVFQTIFRNDGSRPVEYDLNAWSLLHRGRRLPLRTREVWKLELQSGPTDGAAPIALFWALLPTVQRFEPGDYNWGMTSFGLPPGERFDLVLRVAVGGEPVGAEIPSVECAPDR
jgi:hypothetical protein